MPSFHNHRARTAALCLASILLTFALLAVHQQAATNSAGPTSFAPVQSSADITPAAGSSAHTPSVTNATTNEDTQTTSGLVISRNPLDGSEVTHFKIGNIVGGQLFKNDGTTQIPINSFITFAEGNAGLKFTPSPNNWGTLTIEVQSSTSNSDAGVGGIAARPLVTVNPLGDTPSVTNATTNQNTQSRFGLKISRNPADGSEISYLKITNIQNGTLFKHNGTTQINAGDFITFDEGSTGLKFAPANNLTSPSSTFGFDAQASATNSNAGLGGSTAAGSVGVYIPIVVTVNTLGDAMDSNIGDGHCDTDGNLGNGDQCTLRAAIQETNSAAGDDTITFSLPANSTITLNTALPDLNSLTMTGPGATLLTVQRSTVGGTPEFRVFTISDDHGAIISGLTVSNGRALGASFPAGLGGGILNNNGTLEISNCVIKGSNAVSGGGIANLGAMTIENTTVAGNSVTGSGGGILNSTGATQSAVLTMSNSTISNNSASGSGGGLYQIGTAIVRNTTISNNTTGGSGGGINNSNPATLTNVTITGNSASNAGGGIYNPGIGIITFGNTIVAGNTSPSGPDCNGFNLSSQDYNLIGNTSGGNFTGTTTHNITNVNALLGPLAANGGPTFTHALLVGSPAIDAGNSSQPTDQRGQPRPLDDQTVVNAAGGNASDIGAYEAHNLQVNSTADADDGACRSLGTGNGCTLHEAIDAANAEPGAELITFAPALSSGGPATITLSTSLPGLLSDVTIAGPGANLLKIQRSTAGGTPSFIIFSILPNLNVSISGLTVSNGDYSGIFNRGTLVIINCIVDGNRHGVVNRFELVINDSVISNSTETGVENESQSGTTATGTINNSTISGNLLGGVFNSGVFAGSVAKLTVNNSTLSGNNFGDGSGGGITTGGVQGGTASTSINSCTISGNRALITPGFAGGVAALGFDSGSSASVTINDSTITANDAPGINSGAGGMIVDTTNGGAAKITLHNTIVAGNTRLGGSLASDIAGTVDPASSFNLIGSGGSGGLTNGVNNNRVGISDARLGPLANNGGPTQTHALLPGSLAIDAGDNCVLNNTCAPPLTSAITTDQRGLGFNRAADGNGDGTSVVDIGAFEIQNILVTNTNNAGAGSLRQAITDANATGATEAITFQVGLTGTITLDTAMPDISGNLSITGPGVNLLTVRRSTAGGTPRFRIFTINSGANVLISGMTITNGSTANGADAPTSGGSGANGGGIFNDGALTLADLVVTANQTGNGGNATNPGSTFGGPGGFGGGIFGSSISSLSMTNVSISNNTTGNGGNGGFGHTGGRGGGIFTGGTLTMTACSITGNNTGVGGVGSEPGASGGAGGSGAGVYAEGATVNLTNVIVSGNTTGDGAGVSGNGGFGGGLFFSTGTQTLTNSTVSGNTTGAASPGVAGQGGFGGGIFGQGNILTITNSTISGNHTGTGDANAGYGGGIDNSGSLTMRNSTVTGNSTGGEGGTGGGLWNAGPLTLTNSTIAFNASLATFGGAGIHQFNSSSAIIIHNTIVAHNSLAGNPNGTDLDGNVPYSSLGHNLIRNADGSSGFNGTDQLGTALVPLDPRLASLANNGGPTMTHALLAGSPALDAGDNCVFNNSCAFPYGFSLTSDQRGAGFSRKVDGPDADTTDTVDIGAFEAQVAVADLANQTINEDAPLSLPFNVGGAANVTGVTASSSNTTLVPNNPANISISGTGSTRTLTINPAANLFGTSTITVTVNGSNSQTMTDTFLLTVNSVNDAPSFTKGPDQTVNENDGVQTINNWATNISAGPANESGQAVSFVIVSNNNASLFAVAPAVSPTGTLTYTPATGASGTALITIALMDNGGTANGGLDTSAIQSFNINVRDGGTLSFSAATYNFAEDGGSAAITINRSGGSAGTATVLFATSNGTATAADYTPISQTISFNDGEVSKSVSVPIADDLFNEPNETINLALSNAGGSGQLSSQISAVLTIVDNDPIGGYLHFDGFHNTTENSGVTPIGVERLGTTTQAVTVDYATSDENSTLPCSTTNGVASSRCDFTTARGTLHFAAGETFKVILVLISQDNYVEGPETLTLTLSNVTGGAALTTPATTTLTIADDATEPATNPIDSADAFVRQHYHDFLNREPDPDGLAFWSNQITECQQPGATCSAEVRRINVSAAFFLSIEFQETGYLVERLYKVAYGSANGTSNFGGAHSLAVPFVRFKEFLTDTQAIGQGVVVGQPGWEQALENNKIAFTNEFVQRGQFLTSMSPPAFVDQLFLNAGVTPTTAERNAAINEFGSASDVTDVAARARAVRRVAENPTLAQQEKNSAFVLMQYLGYLRRNPNDAPDSDYTGYDFWLNKLNEFNGNFVNAEMVKAFILSAEYRQRFGP